MTEPNAAPSTLAGPARDFGRRSRQRPWWLLASATLTVAVIGLVFTLVALVPWAVGQWVQEFLLVEVVMFSRDREVAFAALQTLGAITLAVVFISAQPIGTPGSGQDFDTWLEEHASTASKERLIEALTALVSVTSGVVVLASYAGRRLQEDPPAGLAQALHERIGPDVVLRPGSDVDILLQAVAFCLITLVAGFFHRSDSDVILRYWHLRNLPILQATSARASREVRWYLPDVSELSSPVVWAVGFTFILATGMATVGPEVDLESGLPEFLAWTLAWVVLLWALRATVFKTVDWRFSGEPGGARVGALVSYLLFVLSMMVMLFPPALHLGEELHWFWFAQFLVADVTVVGLAVLVRRALRSPQPRLEPFLSVAVQGAARAERERARLEARLPVGVLNAMNRSIAR